MVDTQIFSNNMNNPSPECYMIFWNMTIYSYTLDWSDITLTCNLIIKLELIIEFYPIPRGFHRHVQRMWHARRWRKLSFSSGAAILFFPIGQKNKNLVEAVEILLPVKFCRIPLCGFREVENEKVNDNGRTDDAWSQKCTWAYAQVH